MANAKHPLLLEAIEYAKKAVLSTRGMYPVTVAKNVYKTDGTPLETTPTTNTQNN